MSKLLIKNIELLHTPNGELQNIAIEDKKIAYVGKEVEVEVKTRTLQAPRPDLPHLLPGVKNIIAVSSGKRRSS